MVVKSRKKEKVQNCFACPLCTNLFDQPTTISECLDIFCKNCIEEKLIKEKLKFCPICNVDLGVAPLSKLRPDHTVESLMQKVFHSKQDIVKEGTETVNHKETTISSLLASSSKVSLEPKPMITFSKRRRKTSKPIQNVILLESAQPPKEATPRLDIDLNKVPDNESDEEENNLEKDTEVAAPLNINDTLVNLDEPEITPNQDNVLTSGGDTEEVSGNRPEKRVEDIHNYCVFNRQAEEIPLQVYPNTILISSDGDTKEVSGDEKMKSNNGKKEVSGDEKMKSNGKKEVSGDEKLKSNGKGKQESATSSSRKKPGRKPKNNGGGNQECVTPRSSKISGNENPHYSPPVLRPRRGGRTIHSADRTSEVKKMNSAAATSQVRTMTPTTGKSEVKPMSSGAGTSEVRTMSSGAGTSEVRTMSSGAGTSRVRGMSSGAGTSRARGMSSGAGTSRVRTMSSGAGTSRVRGMSSGAGTSRVGISAVAENRVEGCNESVWFQLIACENQNTDGPVLPQLAASYLKVSRSMTVSYVKTYLVRKLSLQREDQVEIWLRHEPVSSTLPLHDLVEWWVQTAPAKERKSAKVGSSAAEFVMVLYYSFKE